MNKEIKINLFIVPNQGCRYNQMFGHTQESEGLALDRFGVPFTPESKMLQVWIHGCGEDNLSDHGLTDEMLDMFGITERQERY